MVPRGGHCKSCMEYTLWGDVIRGCYRRMRSYSLTAQELSDNLEIQDTKSTLRRKRSVSLRRLKSSKVKETQEPSTSKPRRSRKNLEMLSSPTVRRLPSKGSKKRKQPANAVFVTEGEDLDLVASSEIEDNAIPMKKKRGRPRKDLAILSPEASSSVATIHRLPSKGSKRRKQPANAVFATEGEGLDLVASSDIEDNATPMKKKRGRPRKYLALLSPGASSSVATIRRLSSKGSKKRKQPANVVFATEGEDFEFVVSSEIEDNATPMKKKRGRPRKDLAILSPGASSSVAPPQPLKRSRNPKKKASPVKLKTKEKGSRSPTPY